MSAPTERQVADWLAQLGRLVASNMSPSEAADRLRAYAPELVTRFDVSDFNSASREFVARHCNFFPSYGQLCELLDKWPKPSERPALPAPHADEDPGLLPQDWAWVSFWHKRRSEIFAQQTGFRWATRDADLANLASLIRAQSRRAWAHISGTRETGSHIPTDAEIDAVTVTVERCVAACEDAARQRAQTSRLLPEPTRPMPDVTLKGDALRLSREARGLKVPA
ncbi:MAG: hypothetical protein ACJ8HI_08425 [Massilia sp.]|jgi:hypothetical protein